MGDICNIGGTGMKIGDTLYCLDGSTVTLCYYDSEIIIVEYMGKRYKRPYSALGKKLLYLPLILVKYVVQVSMIRMAMIKMGLIEMDITKKAMTDRDILGRI